MLLLFFVGIAAVDRSLLGAGDPSGFGVADWEDGCLNLAATVAWDDGLAITVYTKEEKKT
jgi:hypothetical protein